MNQKTSFRVGALILFGLLLVIAHWALNEFIRRKLVAVGPKLCTSCRLTVEDIGTSLWRSQITVSGLHLTAGSPKTTAFDIRIPQTILTLEPLQLLEKIVYLQLVQVQSPEVVVTEGDWKTPAAKGMDSAWKFGVAQTSIKDGRFTYIREHKGVPAIINLEHIEIRGSELGNTPELEPKPSRATVEALLEKSGRVELAVSSRVFDPTTNATIDSHLSGLSLEDMNPFFEKGERIVLHGKLIDSKGVVQVSGRELSASVEARYQDLDIHFEKGPDRSAAAAFFSNLLAQIKTNKGNLEKSRAKRKDKVVITRENDETLLTAIFRGLTLAALNVTQKD